MSRESRGKSIRESKYHSSLILRALPNGRAADTCWPLIGVSVRRALARANWRNRIQHRPAKACVRSAHRILFLKGTWHCIRGTDSRLVEALSRQLRTHPGMHRNDHKILSQRVDPCRNACNECCSMTQPRRVGSSWVSLMAAAAVPELRAADSPDESSFQT